MNIKKPNSFARYGNDYVAPLTTIDQIVKPSGERYTNKEFELMSNVENVMFGENSAGKNLLNPTLQTTTANGITCTNNGDGTFTLNGTSTDRCFFHLNAISNHQFKGCKLSGCPSGGGLGKYSLYVQDVPTTVYNFDYGAGTTINIENGLTVQVIILIESNQTCSNLVFKPMITTDLTATYDDFEPYVKSLKQLTDSALNMDLLWTNASPSSSFAAQTVSLNLSNYKFVYIAINDRISQPNNIDNALLMNAAGQSTNILSYYAYTTTYSRIIIVRENGIQFGNEHSNSYDGPIENKMLIPTHIFGIK